MLTRMIPRALLYLDEVSRQGSIQKASRELRISASAIDRQIILMEKDIDALLFERHPTGMRITPAGELYLDLVHRWQKDVSDLWVQIKGMQGLSVGHLKLATMDSLVNGVLPRFLERLASEYPQVVVEVEIMSPDQAVEALRSGSADIALAFNIEAQRDLHVIWNAKLPLGCVVSPDHDLATVRDVSFKQIVAYPLAAQSRTLTIRRYLESHHKWLFSDREPPLVTNSLQLVKQMALRGSHVALTSEIDAAPEILSGDLVFNPISDIGAKSQTICTAIYPHRVLPRIAGVVAHILSEETEALLAQIRAEKMPPMLPHVPASALP